MVRICQSFSCRPNIWELHDDASSLSLVVFTNSETVGNSGFFANYMFQNSHDVLHVSLKPLRWNLWCSFRDVLNSSAGTTVLWMLFAYVFGSLHFNFIHFFLDELKCIFYFLFKRQQIFLFFCALQCGIDSCLRETIVTRVSEVWKFRQRLVPICCHRHTPCVGQGVASIALKPAATALFLEFDTDVLRYGATLAAPRSCHQIWNTLFIKFITTSRLTKSIKLKDFFKANVFITRASMILWSKKKKHLLKKRFECLMKEPKKDWCNKTLCVFNKG